MNQSLCHQCQYGLCVKQKSSTTFVNHPKEDEEDDWREESDEPKKSVVEDEGYVSICMWMPILKLGREVFQFEEVSECSRFKKIEESG